MACVKIGFTDPPRPTSGKLVNRLVDELKRDRPAGQPFIYEEEYPTTKLRVLVVWDEWADEPLEDRTSAILSAYEKAEGKSRSSRRATRSGWSLGS